jgi:ABC-type transporter Mla subunit MlaD
MENNITHLNSSLLEYIDERESNLSSRFTDQALNISSALAETKDVLTLKINELGNATDEKVNHLEGNFTASLHQLTERTNILINDLINDHNKNISELSLNSSIALSNTSSNLSEDIQSLSLNLTTALNTSDAFFRQEIDHLNSSLSSMMNETVGELKNALGLAIENVTLELNKSHGNNLCGCIPLTSLNNIKTYIIKLY